MNTLFTCTLEEIQTALHLVSPAISNEKTRYYLNGVYIHHSPEGVVFVATDGHRLHKYLLAHDEPDVKSSEFDGFIMPRETVKKILAIKRVKHVAEPFHVVRDGDEYAANIKDTTYTFVPIDGTFPDYTRAIPMPEFLSATNPSASFNWRLVSEVGEALQKAFGRREEKSIRIKLLFNEVATAPFRVDTLIPGFTAIIMTMRDWGGV